MSIACVIIPPMFLAQFLTVALVHFLAVISPGPDFAMVTRNSLLYSTKVGVYTSLGLALGMMVHVAYSLLGIGLLISQSVVLFSIIKYIGACYLIYIGYKSLKSKSQDLVSSDEIKSKHKSISISASIWTGFLTNVLNPKATLFMLALFTQVISPATPKLIQILYGLEMVVATFVWFSLVSLFFSNIQIKTRIQKYQHYIEKVTGGVLIALGIKVALTNKD
jgi:RhtB (resistance to homoserine/threonine) family protein